MSASDLMPATTQKKYVQPDKVYVKNRWYQENLKQGKIYFME